MEYVQIAVFIVLGLFLLFFAIIFVGGYFEKRRLSFLESLHVGSRVFVKSENLNGKIVRIRRQDLELDELHEFKFTVSFEGRRNTVIYPGSMLSKARE